MNKYDLAFLLIFFLANPAYGFDSMTQEEMDAHKAMQPCTINPDRWGIREPNQEEITYHGSGILVFEYYNSPSGCSNDQQNILITYKEEPIGLMSVDVLGREFNSNEEITFTPLPDAPYSTFGAKPLLVPDADKPHIIIIYPMIF